MIALLRQRWSEQADRDTLVYLLVVFLTWVVALTVSMLVIFGVIALIYSVFANGAWLVVSYALVAVLSSMLGAVVGRQWQKSRG